MDIKSLINTNLDKAFLAVESLAVDATLSKKIPKDFDFNLVSDKSSFQSVVVKAIKIESKKKSSADSGHNSKSMQLLLKTKDVEDITVYDQLTIDKKIWKVGPVISDTGFVTYIEVFKE